MANKYKIYIGEDVERFKKALIALLDSKLLVYSRSRLKSLNDVIEYYDTVNSAAHDTYWLVVGYTDDWNQCTRCIYSSGDNWNCLYEYREIELEELVRILKDD